MDCVFCAIARGDIPANVVLEDEETLAFHDVNPQAPHHVLVIPRRHISSLVGAGEADAPLLGRCLLQASRAATKLGLDATGYRSVINSGQDALQTVPHLHIHVIGGRPMAWPPG